MSKNNQKWQFILFKLASLIVNRQKKDNELK